MVTTPAPGPHLLTMFGKEHHEHSTKHLLESFMKDSHKGMKQYKSG